jgi:hypothetical protein
METEIVLLCLRQSCHFYTCWATWIRWDFRFSRRRRQHWVVTPCGQQASLNFCERVPDCVPQRPGRWPFSCDSGSHGHTVFKIRFPNIFPIVSRSSMCCLPLRFSNRSFVCISFLYLAYRCSVWLIIIDLIILIVFYEEYKFEGFYFAVLSSLLLHLSSCRIFCPTASCSSQWGT